MKVKGSAKALSSRVKRYVRKNWGAPFILGFMLLLVVAAFSLTTGLDALADEVALYAYYALVAGVVLQLVCFLKFSEKGGDKDS
jgi:heme/copper-type cytochrome/quinol oxidase subunit 4